MKRKQLHGRRLDPRTIQKHKLQAVFTVRNKDPNANKYTEERWALDLYKTIYKAIKHRKTYKKKHIQSYTNI